MPIFLMRGRYSVAGLRGSLQEGFAARAAYLDELVGPYGGTVVGCYWVAGDHEMDVFVILEMPDEGSVHAMEFAINSTGALQVWSVRLFEAEEMDAVRSQLQPYRAPGESYLLA